ncbi:MAG: BglG family transcription antiterminator LicT [Bacilli bacterium]
MQIERILNNNVVTVIVDGTERVVMGRGLAFQKRVGDQIDERAVEKIFTLTGEETTHRFAQLFDQIPPEQLELAKQIIVYAEQRLNTTLHETIYVTLADHIHYALTRYQEGIFLKNPLHWEIKRFYKEEYAIGRQALVWIREQFAIAFEEDEAAAIALHIVNASVKAQTSTDFHKVSEMVKMNQAVVNMIKYHFRVELDESSLAYERFLTHLKYFSQRMLGGESVAQTGDEALFDVVKVRYDEAYRCVEKICAFIEKTYQYKPSVDEQLYLTIHIENVVKKGQITKQ